MVTVLHRVMLIIALGEVWDVASVLILRSSQTQYLYHLQQVYSMVIRATSWYLDIYTLLHVYLFPYVPDLSESSQTTPPSRQSQ